MLEELFFPSPSARAIFKVGACRRSWKRKEENRRKPKVREATTQSTRLGIIAQDGPGACHAMLSFTTNGSARLLGRNVYVLPLLSSVPPSVYILDFVRVKFRSCSFILRVHVGLVIHLLPLAENVTERKVQIGVGSGRRRVNIQPGCQLGNTVFLAGQVIC